MWPAVDRATPTEVSPKANNCNQWCWQYPHNNQLIAKCAETATFSNVLYSYFYANTTLCWCRMSSFLLSLRRVNNLIIDWLVGQAGWAKFPTFTENLFPGLPLVYLILTQWWNKKMTWLLLSVCRELLSLPFEIRSITVGVASSGVWLGYIWILTGQTIWHER